MASRQGGCSCRKYAIRSTQCAIPRRLDTWRCTRDLDLHCFLRMIIPKVSVRPPLLGGRLLGARTLSLISAWRAYDWGAIRGDPMNSPPHRLLLFPAPTAFLLIAYKSPRPSHCWSTVVQGQRHDAVYGRFIISTDPLLSDASVRNHRRSTLPSKQRNVHCTSQKAGPRFPPITLMFMRNNSSCWPLSDLP